MLATTIKNLMKRLNRYWLLLGAISGLASCQSNPQSNKKDSTIAPVLKGFIIAEFISVTQGVWVKIDYGDKPMSTKSPAA